MYHNYDAYRAYREERERERIGYTWVDTTTSADGNIMTASALTELREKVNEQERQIEFLHEMIAQLESMIQEVRG